jgi:hypothetical protein
MLSFSVDGQIVTIIAAGTTTTPDRRRFYEGVRVDPRVPERALLLIDARGANAAGSLDELQERAHLIVGILGSKMGSVCAIITAPHMVTDAGFFQAASGELGVRVGLFNDESQARVWLSDFAHQP